MIEEMAIGQGIEPAMRMVRAAADSGLHALTLGCFVVNALLFPVMLRQWRTFFKLLLRRRFDGMQGERTLSERLVLALALVQTLIFEGLMLFCVDGAPVRSPLLSVVGLTALAVLLMVVQTGGYLAVGYAFSSPDETRSWLHAFFMSQSMLSYLLILPAMAALYYPQYLAVCVVVAVGVYVVCRILFIIKGFAFFYTSPVSLFYFFLYLCTLEIVPLAVVLSLIGPFSSILC